MPPSTTKLAPVMKPDFSRSTRKATTSAISWGLPTRPAGCWVWSLRLSRLYSLVAIQPGLTQLTRMSGPKLMASACVSAKRPPLEAELDWGLGPDILVRVEPMVTIEPFDERTGRCAERAKRKVAVRLVS